METLKNIVLTFLALLLIGVCAGFMKKDKDYKDLKIECDSVKVAMMALHAKDSLALVDCRSERDSIKLQAWHLANEKWALQQRVKRLEEELKKCRKHRCCKVKYKHSRVTYSSPE